MPVITQRSSVRVEVWRALGVSRSTCNIWLTRMWLFIADQRRDSKVQCRYSFRGNLGKPKGSLNKKTLERMRRAAQQPSHGSSLTEQDQETSPRSRRVSTDVGSNISTTFVEPSAVSTTSTERMDLGGEDVDIFGQLDLAGMEFPLFDPLASEQNKPMDPATLHSAVTPTVSCTSLPLS